MKFQSAVLLCLKLDENSETEMENVNFYCQCQFKSSMISGTCKVKCQKKKINIGKKQDVFKIKIMFGDQWMGGLCC